MELCAFSNRFFENLGPPPPSMVRTGLSANREIINRLVKNINIPSHNTHFAMTHFHYVLSLGFVFK